MSSLLSFIAQCLGDRRKQRLRVERFAKEPAYSLSPRLISNLMATRDQENRQLSMRLPDDLAEFDAADHGHANLGDQLVHVRQALCEQRTRRCETAGRVSGRLQKFLQRSDEHTSELLSLMLTSYPVFCLHKI